MSLTPENVFALTDADAIPRSISNNVSTDAPFTTRVQLLHPQSGVRTDWDKERGNKPDEGVFWLGPPGGIDLGKEFLAVPILQRDHALRTKGSEAVAESFKAPPLGVLPQDDAERVFADIKSKLRDKSEKGVQNRVGKDVLLWVIPQPKVPNGKFAVYFLAGTAVPEAKNFEAYARKLVRIRSRNIDTGTYSWYVPEVEQEEDGSLEPDAVPNRAHLMDEMAKFLNPISKLDGVTRAAEGTDGRPR